MIDQLAVLGLNQRCCAAHSAFAVKALVFLTALRRGEVNMNSESAFNMYVEG